MGWDFGRATHYYKNGKINRKAECDSFYNWEKDGVKQEVLKSAIVRNVYYAAIKRINDVENTEEVFACVCLIKTDNCDFYNFGTKVMTEYDGPCYYDCPASILELLTETDDKYAKKWREECWKYVNLPLPSKLPIGSIIEFEWSGKNIRIEKVNPTGNHKRPFWTDGLYYMPQKWIPRDYVLVK